MSAAFYILFRLKFWYAKSNRVLMVRCTPQDISMEWLNSCVLSLPDSMRDVPFSQHIQTYFSFSGMHHALLVLDYFDAAMEGSNISWEQFLQQITYDIQRNRNMLTVVLVCKKLANIEAIMCKFANKTEYIIMEHEERGGAFLSQHVCDASDRMLVEKYSDILYTSVPF